MKNKAQGCGEKSNETREKLINSAVEMMATNDTLENISIRNITEKVGITVATIRYHFQDKANFIKAVGDAITKLREGRTIRDFYNKNKKLLETRDGQIAFISSMIDDYCESYRANDIQTQLKFRLFFKLAFCPGVELSETMRRHYQDDFSAFYEICKCITGNDDPELVYIWFNVTMFPLSSKFSGGIQFDSLGDNLNFTDVTATRMTNYCKLMLMKNMKLLTTEIVDKF